MDIQNELKDLKQFLQESEVSGEISAPVRKKIEERFQFLCQVIELHQKLIITKGSKEQSIMERYEKRTRLVQPTHSKI